MSYYDILEVDISASEKEIKKSYKRLVKKYHPDVYKGNLDFAEQKIKEINEAYDILSNSESRKQYDNELSQDNYGYNNSTPPDFSNSNDSFNRKSNTPSYEDLYKYDYYKKYTTNYYGVDKSNEKNDSFYRDMNHFNTVRFKLTPFSLVLIIIILIFFLTLIINSFILSVQKLFSTSIDDSESVPNNTTQNFVDNTTDTDIINTFTRNTTYSDITNKLGIPLSEYYYENYLYVFYEKYYFIFDENNKLIDWSYTGF